MRPEPVQTILEPRPVFGPGRLIPGLIGAALLLLVPGCAVTAWPGPDGGAPIDAGADAGALDAGPGDAGPDGGLGDAGADGGGSSDAGLDGGGSPDGGLPNPCGIDPGAGAIDLWPGDDLQAANDGQPAGTTFFVRAGVHLRAQVMNPKVGNRFVGEVGAVLDGQGSVREAFSGSATGVEIAGLRITGYVDNGIHFTGGSGVRVTCVEIFDTGTGSGEANGAVVFDAMSDLQVTRSHFERVSSGVLPTGCTGPIRIEDNTGLNIGRNFVQLADVQGGGIRVLRNSMERDGIYVRTGNDDVEDWISVWKVVGLPTDPVQISFNRARGHGPSASGSFIMLGDGGGRWQEAVGNIGVTPGQVGIGLSGGYEISVRDNLMFSEIWAASNIAIYSADYGTGGCGDHTVTGNRANWINKDGVQNDFWSSGACTPLTEGGNVFPDASLDATIWDAWP